MGTLALIGLGSNLGDRKAHLDFALTALARTAETTLRAASASHETAPVGGPGGQPAFLNAAVALETALEPELLLRILLEIEDRAGRTRAERWGPRTLDLDLLLFGDQIIEQAAPLSLRVPHPRMALRRFVLAPLAEIAPDAIDPLTHRSVLQLLKNLDRRPSYVALENWEPGLPDSLFAQVFDVLIEALDAAPVRVQREGLLFRGGPAAAEAPAASALSAADSATIEAALDAHVRRLDRQRWPAQGAGASHWVASNFWLYALFARLAAAHANGFPVARHFADARLRGLEPTFAVSFGRTASSLRAGLRPAPAHWLPPVLEIGPERGDVEAIVADILTACAATRS